MWILHADGSKRAAYMDFLKSFDPVPNLRLLFKLKSNDISHKAPEVGRSIIEQLKTESEDQWNKRYVLYSAVSSPFGPLKALNTFPPLTDLFIPTPTRMLLEAFLPCKKYVQRLFTHISTTVYSHVLIYITK